MRATLRLELTTGVGDGRRLVEEREARNSVMQAGADLVAHLFAGQGTPITHMGVGTSSDPESERFDTGTLSNDAVGDTPPLDGATEVELPADAFTFTVDTTRRVVSVRIRGSLPNAAAVGIIREAGLIARDGDGARLYNRVTFAPLEKGGDHDLTMFWDVSFPYGDIQWLM
jgi:hypothetical protein